MDLITHVKRIARKFVINVPDTRLATFYILPIVFPRHSLLKL